jgi:anti-sigma regulatory factor (Ser/Thr protein kinase)
MDTEAANSDQAESASTEVEFPLSADVEAPGKARAIVRARWSESDDEVLDDLTLIVSELVSNAVQHGEPQIVLRMRTDPLSVDISVLDHGRDVPSGTVVAPDRSATSGRGLTIVDHLANDWGVVPFEGAPGKTVWARLNVPN